MTREDFLQRVADKIDTNVDLTMKLVDALAGIIADEVVKGNNVSIQGFGTFENKKKNDRKFYNPSTRSYSVIPGYSTMNFKMSGTLKDAINAEE